MWGWVPCSPCVMYVRSTAAESQTQAVGAGGGAWGSGSTHGLVTLPARVCNLHWF